MTWLTWLGRRTGLSFETSNYASQRRPADRPARQAAVRAQTPSARLDDVGARPVNLTELLELEVAQSARPGRSGEEVFAARCRVMDRDNVRCEQLLVPPAPYRGHLRLFFARDPNPGPDGEECWVLIPVAPTVMTCHEAAAASFLIHPDFYSPAVET